MSSPASAGSSAAPRHAHGDSEPRRHVHAGGSQPGPHGSRLLAGWYETGRAAGLREHLERYGAVPLAGSRSGALLIEAVERSGLTGRGGAAFPAGRKLTAVARAGGPAVVVANGMDSEPASQKDETLLTLAPHLVLDGVTLAAGAVGAQQAHLCLPRHRCGQVAALRDAVNQRRKRRMDPVPIQVHGLPGNYVSSEETSLVQWLNGGDARPASTPPRPFERGVGKLPTFVGNAETLAHLALIARYGPAWFRSLGAADAPGTTLVTLAGGFTTPGVYEVELGAPLRDVLELGAPADVPEAVMLGGFLGSWLPLAEAAGLPYSQPALAAVGAAIGPGLVLALAPGSCGLSETARVLSYLAAQSAGQCGPCRFGLPAAARDFADLAWRHTAREEEARLDERIWLLNGRGACKHPDGASRLAASALCTFAAEARRHRAYGPCAAALAQAEHELPLPAAEPTSGQEWR